MKYIYPHWALSITNGGLALSTAGLALFVFFVILYLITDKDIKDIFDVTEKPAMYTLIILLIGVSVFVAGVVAMIITGTPIDDVSI